MWQAAGVIRNGSGLTDALTQLRREFPSSCMSSSSEDARLMIEWKTLRTAAECILQSAVAREESRGGHYREDFPHRNPSLDRHHSFLSTTQPVHLASRPNA
jgi:L-aspartate oxidase